MGKKSVIICTCLLIVLVTGCSQQKESDMNSSNLLPTSSLSESVTVESSEKTIESTTVKKEKPSQDKITSSKSTSKATQTTAKKYSSVQQKITKKRTTTNNTSTTKKKNSSSSVSTTAKHCTNNNNHSIGCGNMGRWFSSRNELANYYNNKVNYWNEKISDGEITDEEYIKNCPQGYEAWSCSYCGKWTGNFTY